MTPSHHPHLAKLFNETVHRKVLSNGMTVLHKPDFSADVVSVQAWIRTGSIHEAPLLGSGLSHFLEHMLFKGTERRSPSELSREVHALGGYTNAYTTYDRTVYYIDGPATAFTGISDILADMVFHARIPADEFDSERDVILREIDMGFDDSDRQLMQTLTSTVFRAHPYRLPIIGHRELFESLSHEELVRYYRERYTPEHVVWIVVGAVEESALEAVLEKHLEPVSRRRSSTPMIPPEPEQLAPRHQALTGDVQLFRGALAWKIPGMAHPDAPALDMLATLLGWGDSALLWKEIRDRQRRVSYIDAAAWTPLEAGVFWINYSGEPETAVKAASAIREYLASLGPDQINEAAMEKARQRALVSEINARKTMSGQASRLGLAEVVVGDLNFSQTYFNRLAVVDVEQLLDLIPKTFVEERETAVTYAPKDSAVSTNGMHPSVVSRLPDFSEQVLANGVRLLLQPDPRLPKAHMRCGMLGGPLYEAPEHRGISNLAAVLLTRDTECRDADAVAEAIESVGGTFSDFSGNNTLGVAMEVLRDDLELAVGLLGEALLQFRIDPETFAIERDSLLADFDEAMDEVVSYAQFELRRQFFGDHPYNLNRLGTADTLRALSPESVSAHLKRLLVGPNLVVAVSGDFDPATVDRMLIPILESLPAGPFAPRNLPFPGPAAPGLHTFTQPREQAVVMAGYPDVGVTDSRALLSEMLDECFSGMSSRLFERVREEQGLAYFVGAARTIGMNCGMFTFYAGTHPNTADRVFEEFDREVKRVVDRGLEEEEFRSCQTRLKARRSMGLQTSGSRSMQAVLNALYAQEINDWNSYPARVDAIKPRDLQAFAAEHFRPEARVQVLVRPDKTAG